MLSDIEARKAKPQDKPYKLTDSKGLYLGELVKAEWANSTLTRQNGGYPANA